MKLEEKRGPLRRGREKRGERRGADVEEEWETGNIFLERSSSTREDRSGVMRGNKGEEKVYRGEREKRSSS